MARTFKVAPNCCILTPDGKKMFTTGTIVTDRDFSAGLIKEHVNSGYLLPQNAPEVADKIPGAVTIPPPPIETTLEGAGKNKVIEITPKGNSAEKLPELQISEQEAAAKVAAGKKGPDLSPWVLDPAELAKNDDLTALNLMILERDANGKEMETIEEARAFLSQDFGK